MCTITLCQKELIIVRDKHCISVLKGEYTIYLSIYLSIICIFY